MNVELEGLVSTYNVAIPTAPSQHPIDIVTYDDARYVIGDPVVGVVVSVDMNRDAKPLAPILSNVTSFRMELIYADGLTKRHNGICQTYGDCREPSKSQQTYGVMTFDEILTEHGCLHDILKKFAYNAFGEGVVSKFDIEIYRREDKSDGRSVDIKSKFPYDPHYLFTPKRMGFEEDVRKIALNRAYQGNLEITVIAAATMGWTIGGRKIDLGVTKDEVGA